jgi:hypothetical protein
LVQQTTATGYYRREKLRWKYPTPSAWKLATTRSVELGDARRLSVPLVWYPRLLKGSPEEHRNHRLVGNGMGIHWDDLEEDISIENLLAEQAVG